MSMKKPKTSVSLKVKVRSDVFRRVGDQLSDEHISAQINRIGQLFDKVVDQVDVNLLSEIYLVIDAHKT